MNSRERLLTAIGGGKPDHVPLYCWVFGFSAPSHLRWTEGGRQVAHWYTMRMEHIHTLPQPWGLEQDFERSSGRLARSPIYRRSVACLLRRAESTTMEQ